MTPLPRELLLDAFLTVREIVRREPGVLLAVFMGAALLTALAGRRR
jgi:hypothetical protein